MCSRAVVEHAEELGAVPAGGVGVLPGLEVRLHPATVRQRWLTERASELSPAEPIGALSLSARSTPMIESPLAAGKDDPAKGWWVPSLEAPGRCTDPATR